ncbi:MAG TPA: thioredoxin family protein, partial [Acidimicrobiia bacterium]
FLFGPDRKLVYRGRMDEARPGNEVPVTGNELRAAIDAVLAGEPVTGEQHASMGCSIKWAEGRQPAYFG